MWTAQTLASVAYSTLPEFPTWKVQKLQALLSGSMPSAMNQCYEIQRTWPDPANAPYIVDTVGCIMYEEEFADLENIIKDWASNTGLQLTGEQAWQAIQKKILRGQKSSTLGFESMVRASGDTTQCGSEHPEGFERVKFGAAIVAVESNCIFEFLENLLVGSDSDEIAWIQAMKGLGVKVAKPNKETMQVCFKASVMEAMQIECRTLGWIKLVKACLCFEVARHVKAPTDGLPVSAMEDPPQTEARAATPARDVMSAPLLHQV